MAAAKRIQIRNNIREGPPDNVDGGVWETVHQLIYVTIFNGIWMRVWAVPRRISRDGTILESCGARQGNATSTRSGALLHFCGFADFE